jgi:hypothetical protein
VKSIIEADLNPVPLNELPRARRDSTGSQLSGRNPHEGGFSSSDSDSSSGSSSSTEGGPQPPAGFLAGVGRVGVSRGAVDAVGGYTWTITFLSAVGDVPQVLRRG